MGNVIDLLYNYYWQYFVKRCLSLRRTLANLRYTLSKVSTVDDEFLFRANAIPGYAGTPRKRIGGSEKNIDIKIA